MEQEATAVALDRLELVEAKVCVCVMFCVYGGMMRVSACGCVVVYTPLPPE